MKSNEIRNIAIIAHVDHGKTTLTDQLMKQCGMVEEGVSMDSNALELERGITIYSKVEKDIDDSQQQKDLSRMEKDRYTIGQMPPNSNSFEREMDI